MCNSTSQVFRPRSRKQFQVGRSYIHFVVMKLSIALFFIFAVIFSVEANKDKSACSLPKDSGPCRALIPMFFYDAASKECQEFAYGGCEGNANAFATKADCEKLCK